MVKGGGGGGARSRFTKVTYRYILKNYVQSKAFLVVVTFRPLRILRDAKRKPSSSFCIYEWHHCFFFPEWTALINEQSMLLSRPSAKDCTPQKSNTAFLDFEISIGCGRKRKMGFLLVNQYFLLPLVKNFFNTFTFWSSGTSR